jgi:hypothetical protein
VPLALPRSTFFELEMALSTLRQPMSNGWPHCHRTRADGSVWRVPQGVFCLDKELTDALAAGKGVIRVQF